MKGHATEEGSVQEGGCSPLSSSPSLNCPLSPIRSCSCSRGGTGGLAPGGCTMAGSGVVSRGAADGSISCGAAGSGWRLWQQSEERAEHPARVRAWGEEETPAQSIRETRTGSKQTPPAAPRQPLPAAASSLTSPAAERGQVGERCRLPALPFPSPPQGAPPAAGAAPGSAAGREPGLGGSSHPCGAACGGTVGAGEVARKALVSRPQGLLALESPQAPAKGAAGP